MNWKVVAPDFEWDGSLRDIYVLETSEADWQTVWEALQAWDPPPVFAVDGVTEPMPDRVEVVLTTRRQRSPLLSVQVGHAGLNCHFFSPDEIEFDLDPRQVTRETDMEAIAAFMKLLGDLTRKNVILTAENSREAVIAHYGANTPEVVWTAQRSA